MIMKEIGKWKLENGRARGLTLIELLLYVGLASALLLSVSLFLSLLLQARIKHQAIVEVDQQGVQALQLILQTARNAEDVTAPAQGASGASLALDVVPAAADPTVFDVAAGALRVREGGAAAVPLTNARVTASGFSVQNLSAPGTPGTVRVRFTLTYVSPSDRSEFRYEQTFVGSASLR